MVSGICAGTEYSESDGDLQTFGSSPDHSVFSHEQGTMHSSLPHKHPSSFFSLVAIMFSGWQNAFIN